MDNKVEISYSVEYRMKNFYNKDYWDGLGFDNLEEAKSWFIDCQDMYGVKEVKLIKETKCPVDYQVSHKGCNVKYVVCHRKKTNKGYDNEQFFNTPEEANAFYDSILSDIDNYVFIKEPYKLIEETLDRS